MHEHEFSVSKVSQFSNTRGGENYGAQKAVQNPKKSRNVIKKLFFKDVRSFMDSKNA